MLNGIRRIAECGKWRPILSEGLLSLFSRMFIIVSVLSYFLNKVLKSGVIQGQLTRNETLSWPSHHTDGKLPQDSSMSGCRASLGVRIRNVDVVTFGGRAG